ncbi:MAG: demethylmenaquinone methyltransferase/2-methoxy-6-polyprenyl-1,4-benzoquinol methylase [Limisphaerales bacterium]|jgi:demethylmenaquinone methyltransferase/2-methoxy-6-polyprenyl-1,4-benzoquinol methylase
MCRAQSYNDTATGMTQLDVNKAEANTSDVQSLSPHPVLDEYYATASDRRDAVDELFDSTAAEYDGITDIMSFGSGRWYRQQALIRAGCVAGHKVLDVGAGTGVISALAQDIVGEDGEVVALDPSAGMLGQAQARGVRNCCMGLGEALPFPDQTFDLLTMGYALRHVADLRMAFSEYRRVLKPGGRILLLEITRPSSTIGRGLLKFYMKGIVPNVGRLRSVETKKLMRYYWDTIDSCVPPETIVQAIADAGFAQTHRHKVMGIFSEYSGVNGE